MDELATRGRQPTRSNSACAICTTRERATSFNAAAEHFGWSPRRKRDQGTRPRLRLRPLQEPRGLHGGRRRGGGRARDRPGPRSLRFVAANDSGEIVNPDGIRNQIEGGIVQSASWTLREAVTFDETRITSPIGAPTRSCASPICPSGWRCISSTGQVSLFSAPARPRRDRPRRRLPMPLPMRRERVSANCRSRLGASKPPWAFEPALPLWCGVGSAAAEPGRPRRHHIVRNRTQWPPLPPDE